MKEGDARNFLIVDAAMNDLIRPTLYDAFHEIFPVVRPAVDAPRMVVDVVGPVCETGDYIGLSRDLPRFESGDLIAVGTARRLWRRAGRNLGHPRLASEVRWVGGGRHLFTSFSNN